MPSDTDSECADDYRSGLEDIDRSTDTVHSSDQDAPTALSREVIGAVLKYSIPNKYFRKELPNSTTFMINSEEWNTICQTQKGSTFKQGTWLYPFTKGLKQSNKHCVFMFKKHRVSTAFKRKTKQNTHFFSASAKCKFSDCPVNAKLTITCKKSRLVNVQYYGHVKHAITELRARPISGRERTELKKEFTHGQKPLGVYLERLRNADPETIVSGNADGMGKDSHVYCQIAAESRQVGRMDDDCFKSLVNQMEKQKEDGRYGFIQKICLKPSYILYWSEEGIRLYHELAKKSTVFWDATGSVVRRSEDGKRFLYYEMALRNPRKGVMGVPVTAMISDNQTLPIVTDWIESFRHAEKKLLGHSNVCQPKMITSDESMVFIIAALKCFNLETLTDYLQRCWNIFKGTAMASDVLHKTIVHLCTSHFMHKVKRYCFHHYNTHLKFGMFMVSMLLNTKSMEEAEELLFDI
jgi:hypothetical protein